MKSRVYILPALLAILCGVLISFYVKPTETPIEKVTKINGVSFVAPEKAIEIKAIEEIKRVHANWISVIPYSYIPKNSSEVIFFKDHPHWWGEGVVGSIQQIILAQSAGFKVMVKPHVWVVKEGWPGEFAPDSEEGWLKWESSYSKYILTYAHISDSLNVELFCIGTEFRIAVVQRPAFWKNLIKEVKKVYHGKITYAANWDNYQNINFWKDLDYIGIDAYFPLSEARDPDVDDLIDAWLVDKEKLKTFSLQHGKDILFTEYGYRSKDFAARKPWSEEEGSINIPLQADAYQALYSSFWKENWMAGGFLWKWFPETTFIGGNDDPDYTPQNKQAEVVISEWYQRHN